MKVRRFYPDQVFKRLDGRQMSELSAGESAALSIAVRRNRRIGRVIGIIDGLITVGPRDSKAPVMFHMPESAERLKRLFQVGDAYSVEDPPEVIVGSQHGPELDSLALAARG